MLMDMGFSKSMCKAALKKYNNNMDKALDKLLNDGDQFIGVDNSDDSGDGNESQPIESVAQREQREMQAQIEASIRME